MAWTEQSWRHSLALLPDPAQVLDEWQFRAAISGVPLSSEPLTPYAWTYEDRLTVHAIPLPDSGLTFTTRMAIAAVPGVNLSDSLQRDGDLDATIASFATDLDGTFSSADIDGDLVSIVSPFSASLAGTFQYRHYFDITYSVTPIWAVAEIPGQFGDLDATVSAFTTDFVGTFQDVDDRDGDVIAIISDFSTDFDGTFALAPGRDGDFTINVAKFASNITGASVAPGGAVGELPLVLGGFSTDFSGTAAVWMTDGLLSRTLGAFNLVIDGQFIDADSTTGTLKSAVAGFTFSAAGSTVLPEIERIEMRADTPESAKMNADTPATARMKVR